VTVAIGNGDRRFRLLVFDWDGTIIDSIGSIVGCMNATVAELGLPEIADETIRGTIGLGLSDTLEILMPGSGEPLRRRVVECYRRHWLGGWADRHALIAGAHEALLALGRDGYWLSVATGKGRRGFERDVARFGLAELFLATRTVDEAPSKPSPDMILGLLDELGVRPDEALMVGDTLHDLRMAAAARVPAVGVCSGSACRSELEGHDPAGVLPDVTHLAHWLAS
jgi:phosphoglycolate phosphatase